MQQALPEYNTTRAVLAVIISVLALSLGDALIKASSLTLPLWQMYILRSVLVLPALWLLAARYRTVSFGSVFWVAVRSSLLVGMWLSYYSALPLMPLSLAAAGYYTSPIIITILAAVVARRWPAPRTLFAIALGFCGVLLVLRPVSSGFQLGALLPIIAAFLYACAMVLTSTKCRDDNPFALALSLNLAFIVAGGLLGLKSGREGSFIFGPWQPVDPVLFGIVTALAVVILVGSLGAAIAYQNGPPATVAAFDYSYLVFSLVWGSVFFGEWPDTAAITGIVAITAAGFLALTTSG
ncbi:DMT family transporter [Stappia sp. ES.058]|uniref:DMT family transporter n=1 Tax=Stappia sp. ES.058 TaxID=1881061 RepID=UPI00087D6C8C|nr:DMT family transporter [Stappia sp. ES.058]SDU18787.1 EamA-like transporter family protein [Stappia sp. ES.058]